jgi:hypothetical protein
VLDCNPATPTFLSKSFFVYLLKIKIMKKSRLLLRGLILFTMIVLVSSCEKQDCNCGVITDDQIIGGEYTLSIRNDCTNNVETFIFSYDVWFNAYVGEDFCVTNVESWK